MKPIRMILLACAFATAMAAHAQEQEVAALVNGETITQVQVQRAFDAVLERQAQQGGAKPDEAQAQRLRGELLNQLIAQRLLWQEAKRKNILASEADVDEVIKQVREGLADEAAFDKRLKEAGMTEADYREDLRQRLSVRLLVRDEITSNIEITDKEIEDFYTNNSEQFRQPAQANARHILIKVAPDASESAVDAARQQIDAVLVKAKAGADFADLAREHSQGPSAPNGGDLGFLRHDQLVKPFADAAFGLEPGQVSDVVRTRFGFHIIKLEELRDVQVMPAEEAAEKIRDYLFAQKSREMILARVRGLRDAGKVEISGL